MLTSKENELMLNGYIKKIRVKGEGTVVFDFYDDTYGIIQCVAARRGMYSFFTKVDYKKKYRFIAQLKGHNLIDEYGMDRTYNRIYLKRELREGE
jgi:aspartyl-tRNA synthetase